MSTTADAAESNLKRSSLRTFLIAFLAAGITALVLIVGLILGASRMSDGKILPGVHAGQVDLSGLTAADARSKLAAAYGALGDGVIDVETPSGQAVIKFSEVGRAADVGAMADRAYSVGRTGDPLSQAVDTAATLLRGADIPVMVKFDPSALAARLRALSDARGVLPQSAQVDVTSVPFKVVPSILGHGLDEDIIGRQIVDQLSRVDAPREFPVTATFVEVKPQIVDEQAQSAAEVAEKMVGDISLTLNSKTYTLPASTVRQSIVFGLRADGSFGPTVDQAPIRTYLAGLATKIAVAPVDPSFLLGKNGQPVGITSGKNGSALNIDSTTDAIVNYIESLGAGASPAAVSLAVNTVPPKMTDAQMKGLLPEMTKLGGWTVKFYSSIANCYGKNIRTPAAHINGTVVQPGKIFSFWDSVGPVDQAHGFCPGGVIRNGRSDYTGAMGGGICSASTTMFNAALWAGVEIVERHSHYYWIDRYPAGLDATVYWDGPSKFDMRWRNDTDYPILVIGKSTSSSVTFELWSVKTGRTVTIPQQIVKRNIVHATWKTVYVTTLPPGVRHTVEGAYDGFKITRTRTVKDASGKVIHADTFYTTYGKVDGIIEIGVSKAPSPTTTPAAGVLLLPFVLRKGRPRRRQPAWGR